MYAFSLDSHIACARVPSCAYTDAVSGSFISSAGDAEHDSHRYAELGESMACELEGSFIIILDD